MGEERMLKKTAKWWENLSLDSVKGMSNAAVKYAKESLCVEESDMTKMWAEELEKWSVALG